MSFRLKTILGIALIELTIMGILIGINQFALGGSATTQLYQRAEATARVFSNAVADAVIATDLATLDATIGTAVTSEELTYLRIRNPDGIVLSEGGAADSLAVPFQRDYSYETATSDHLIDIDLPVVVEGVTYGWIELGLSTLSVEQEIAQAFRLNVIVAVIGMSLVAIFGYGLGSILTRQLHWLRQGARAVTAGDLGCQIRVSGRDELADTARCFNEMARTLAQDRAVLQDQRNELLAKKERVEVIVHCMTHIARGKDLVDVPDVARDDEIGDMARATVVFQEAMQAVEQARIEQQRLISAFGQLDEQVSIFDTNGMALFLNEAFKSFNAEILAELPDQFSLKDFLEKGHDMGAFQGIDEDRDTWVRDQLQRKNGSPQELKQGGQHVLLTVQSAVDGIGVVRSAQDITQLRHSEHQLIQASKMATLGEMATGIAHELNQPLGVIRMAASNCVKRIERDKFDAEYFKTKLQRMGEQTERASQIINHMRVFGRKADGVKEPFDLRASLEEMSTLSRAQLQTLDIGLKVNIPDESAMVMGEKVIFEQVLLNLVSNARDAIEAKGDGKGVIHVDATFDTDRGHRIQVRDSGGGIPEDILDKLFEPFFTTKEPGKGTGLGLSISFGTIEEMGGQISACNDSEGACFSIELPPLTEAEAA